MRALGTARRGDVVFLRQTEPWDDQDATAWGDLGADLYRHTGVQIVVLGPGAAPVNLAPHRRVTARRGPTPRWMRS